MEDLALRLFEQFNPNVEIEFERADTSISVGYLPQHSLLQNISKLKTLGWEPKTDFLRIYTIDIERIGVLREEKRE